jgi:inhibitor of nuclear factor kappa-B kinase subunit alpha/inhibitor of nuclear factor kappa-B kinase subunit beta
MYSYIFQSVTVASRYNYSVDYWSLGLVSHEVITGVRPFLPNMAPVSWYVLKRMHMSFF